LKKLIEPNFNDYVSVCNGKQCDSCL